MLCKYIADDGTEFEDYDECEEYERKQALSTQLTESKFWDMNGNRMTIANWLRDPEDCDFMEIANNQEAMLVYKYLREDVGLCHPWEQWRTDAPTKGRYYYCRKDESWHNFETDHAEIIRVLNIFEG